MIIVYAGIFLCLIILFLILRSTRSNEIFKDFSPEDDSIIEVIEETAESLLSFDVISANHVSSASIDEESQRILKASVSNLETNDSRIIDEKECRKDMDSTAVFVPDAILIDESSDADFDPELIIKNDISKEETVPDSVDNKEIIDPEPIFKPVTREKKKKTNKKRKKTAPIKRGGKPRTEGETKPGYAGIVRQYQSRPELVCWQRERVWYVGVDMPEDKIAENPVLTQDAVCLPQDEFDEYRWILNDLNRTVEIQYETITNDSIPISEDYYLFKLSWGNLTSGRYVKNPSYGAFLVITPETWTRDFEVSGPALAHPEPVKIHGYKGHFFNLIKGDENRIGFRTENDDQVTIESVSERFVLVGNQLCNSHEKMGPLFGEGPIEVKSMNGLGWTDVSSLIIGEEGSGIGRWRTEFVPRNIEPSQELPSEVTSRNGGWYFIRFYDLAFDLIESIDFRFIQGLTSINVMQPPFIPSDEGHGVVHVELSHDSHFTIESKHDLDNDVEILREENSTIFKIPAKDICDDTFWIVGPPEGPHVELNINVERIWWGIEREDNLPSVWTDLPILLTRDDFSPTSNKALYLKFPRPRWVSDKMFVGFGQKRLQAFNALVNDKTAFFPLRNFGDTSEVENKGLDGTLSVWIEHDDCRHQCNVAILESELLTPVPDQPSLLKPICYGFGRKRTAIAKAMIYSGPSEIIVNDEFLWKYFENAPKKAKLFLERLLNIDEVGEILLNVQVHIIVKGSSPHTNQQARAVTHALARALMALDEELKTKLKRMNDFGGVKVRGFRKDMML